jgi:catechol 2,3-dioxygenase-like lactoylglutathione lyase family enzyme
MEFKLEVVVVPVADVDRSKAFYTEQCGFALDVDHQDGDFRVVQLTPPGSACSIAIGPGGSTPGSLQGVQLVVEDIVAAREHFAGRGLDCTPVRRFEGGQWIDGPGGPWNSFFFFSDPDGNGWTVQGRPPHTHG